MVAAQLCLSPTGGGQGFGLVASARVRPPRNRARSRNIGRRPHPLGRALRRRRAVDPPLAAAESLAAKEGVSEVSHFISRFSRVRHGRALLFRHARTGSAHLIPKSAAPSAGSSPRGEGVVGGWPS